MSYIPQAPSSRAPGKTYSDFCLKIWQLKIFPFFQFLHLPTVEESVKGKGLNIQGKHMQKQQWLLI